MSLKASVIILLSIILFSCNGITDRTPAEETYDYLINELSFSESTNSVFLLQNPRTVCGGCINTGNKIALRHELIPTITTLDRKTLIRSEYCVIDTSGLVFELLPSTLASYALFKKGDELTFIPLENENLERIEARIQELSLD